MQVRAEVARVVGEVAECKAAEVTDLSARLEASKGKDREAVKGALDLAEAAQDAAQAKQQAVSQLPAGGSLEHGATPSPPPLSPLLMHRGACCAGRRLVRLCSSLGDARVPPAFAVPTVCMQCHLCKLNGRNTFTRR